MMNIRAFGNGLRACPAIITKVAGLKKALLTCGVFLLVAFPACNNSAHNDAKQVAEEIKAAVKANRPRAIPTKEDGYRMKAKMGGKEWEATSMMPLEAADRVIGYKGESYIGFSLNLRYVQVGKKIELNENNAADLSIEGDAGFWGGRKGEVVVTKMDDQWIEGTFYFTGSSQGTNKTVEVTDGFFRVAIPANAAR